MENNTTVEQLQTVNCRLRELLDQIDEGALILDVGPLRPPGPQVLYVNGGLMALTGFRFEELSGQPFGRLYEESRLVEFLQRLPATAASGGTFLLKAPVLCRDGSEKSCAWKLRAVTGSDGKVLNYLMTLVEDVPAETERSERSERSVELGSGKSDGLFATFPDDAGDPQYTGSPFLDDGNPEEEMSVTVIDDAGTGSPTEVESVHLQKSKMESLALVASGIAHDFNNVLTTVIANLSMAKLDSTLGTELREHIDDAAKAADNAKSLTEQLLAFARGGKQEQRKLSDVGEILRDAAKLSTYGAAVRCDLNIDEGLWSAEIDVTQITQVINNLLINARQAMKDTGVIQANLENVSLSAEDGVAVPSGNYLRLKVVDHGCGISAENLERIFDAFFTTKKTGTGLGLATCQTIIRKHGGLITVDSTLGVGTEFTVFLPATGEQAEEGEDDDAGRVFEGEGAILVVDDQDDVRAVASAMLRRLGYEVSGAADGEEAVKSYRRRMGEGSPFAAVLMDMTLPGGMSGSETTEELRKLDPFATVIASSGYFEEAATDGCLRDGFAGVLSKPYDLEQLSAALHRVLSE